MKIGMAAMAAFGAALATPAAAAFVSGTGSSAWTQFFPAGPGDFQTTGTSSTVVDIDSADAPFVLLFTMVLLPNGAPGSTGSLTLTDANLDVVLTGETAALVFEGDQLTATVAVDGGWAAGDFGAEALMTLSGDGSAWIGADDPSYFASAKPTAFTLESVEAAVPLPGAAFFLIGGLGAMAALRSRGRPGA